MIVGNKTFTDVAKPNEIVQLLLNEDQLANLEVSGGTSSKAAGKRPAGADASIDLWNEEGDEFFGGQSTTQAPGNGNGDDDDEAPKVVTSTRGRKRGRGGASGESTPRGRGRGRGRKKVTVTGADTNS